MNNLPEILRSTKPQLKGLSPKGLERVKKILEKEIERIRKFHMKGKKK